MSNKENILVKLREHVVQPPPHVCEQIIAKLQSSEQEDYDEVPELLPLAKLQTHSCAVPGILEQQVLAAIAEEQGAHTKKLVALRDYEMQQPAGIFEKIGERIRKGSGQRGVIYWISRHKAAAASIAAVMLAATLYISIGKNNQVPTMPDDALATTKEEQPVDTAVQLPASDTTGSRKLPVMDHHLIYQAMKRENFFFSNTLKIDGWNYNMGNQDMLAAFASFQYKDMPAAFWEKSREETAWLQVDDYTAIGVSPAMRDMMKKMYEVRRNGKSTAKAKREKRKLKRWIKADKKRFDKTMSRNPLDPLDLADFIFD